MEEKVLQILEEHCIEALDYDGDSMMEDGIIDSFTVINVVSDLEDEFDIEFNMKDVVSMKRGGDMVDIIQQEA